MQTEKYISWFSEYYQEILDIFYYLPGTKTPSQYKLNINTNQAELISEIYLKLVNHEILNTKRDILLAVEKFAQRKRKFRKSARKF